jgi:2-aminoadipate transaminase
MGMTDYTRHLSTRSRTSRESAIRRTGDIAASRADVVSLAPGFPDPDSFPWDEVRDIAASLLTGGDRSALQYGPTRGYPPLLAGLAEIMADRGIRGGTSATVTTGSQQALDLCARVFIDPGDVVLLERPSYTGGITAFGNAQARLVCVQQDSEGPSVAHLDEALTRERAAGRRIAFLYVIPNFQNPTGMLTTLARRHELLAWSSSRDVLIVEDDPYGALYFDDVATAAETRPIMADDQDGRVVYLSSFSKTVAPGLRVAWIGAAPALISKFEVAKQTADLCSSSLDQRIVYEIWKRGIFTKRLPLIRQCYRERRTIMEQAVCSEFGASVTWIEPKGGFFLWVTLPEGIDTDALLPRAVDHGVLYVPGSAFHVDSCDPRTARLAFSAVSHQEIRTGIGRLASAVREELDAGPSAVSAMMAGSSSAARSSSAGSKGSSRAPGSAGG